MLPEAGTLQRGIIEIATQAEVTTGTDAERAVTPATLEQRLVALVAALPDPNPSGLVQWHAGATAPTGWLVCNGDGIPNGTGTVQGVNTDFSDLFAVLGAYGTDGANRRLPDLQGTFVRGWTDQDAGAYNETTNPDPNRTRGSRQNNAIEQHAHSINQTPHTHSLFNQISGAGGSVGGGGSATTNANTGGANANITVQNVTGATTNNNETRPTNIALLPIIKI